MSAQWAFSAAAATSTSVLIQLQSPAALSNLTADPPEDLTILRIVGDWTTVFGSTFVGNWTLALTVADVTWTPGATVSVDNDKRLLWQVTYSGQTGVTEGPRWDPPGHLTFATAAGSFATQAPERAVHLDITPRVKVEAGKALYLVAYENSGGAVLTVSSATMRVLYKRSGRR